MNMSIDEFIKESNNWGRKRIPFLFIIDFEMEKPVIVKLNQAGKSNIFYDIKGLTNWTGNEIYNQKEITINSKSPVSKDEYSKAFHRVVDNINLGNSYLLNLTFPTEIEFNTNSLEEIFNSSVAPYKLLYKDNFTIFSPECFIEIKDNKIFSYPMKGTIDADIENAEKILLSDSKEIFEHNTIVDLIRNDLSIVAENISVSRYRYIDKIKSKEKSLLQVSSKIEGELPDDWNEKIGNILIELLPAGSISGAPKKKTVEIIRETENSERGYYTGIFGIFDGQKLDCAVNIRFIEKTGEKFYFRSGGGITALSDCDSEYEELIDKIYVPTI